MAKIDLQKGLSGLSIMLQSAKVMPNFNNLGESNGKGSQKGRC